MIGVPKRMLLCKMRQLGSFKAYLRHTLILVGLRDFKTSSKKCRLVMSFCLKGPHPPHKIIFFLPIQGLTPKIV